MNYLIVMPKGATRGQTTNDVIFPLGTAYVSASLKHAGYAVFTANLEYHEGGIYSVLRKLIFSNKINVVCIGGLSRDCSKIREVLNSAFNINPEIITVVGGGIVTADPEPAMKVLNADIGVIGEGEITICELAHALDNGLPYNNVNGLIYKDKDGALVHTSPRKEIIDIDTILLPDFDGFNYAEYCKSRGGLIVGSRSCPGRCTYCFHPSGKIYRQRSLDSIFAEIDYQIEHYQITAFGLTEELFAVNRKRVLEFCDRIKGYNISWACALRVSDVDLEMLQQMKKVGCESICYGLESADNTVLKSMRKNITAKQIEYTLESTYKANIRVVGQFIFGDIAENMNTVATTLAFWRKHNMKTEISLNMIIAYPGTELYKHACESGLIKDKEKFIIEGCPLINLSKLSGTEYKELLSLTEELKLHPHTLAKAIRIMEIQHNGNCKVEVTCRRCNAISECSMFFWFKNAHPCPVCSLINEVEPFTKAFHLPNDFINRLPADEEIALWGAGGIYYKLINKYDTLFSKRFLLVDADRSLQGLSICKKIIYSPDVIANRNIKIVVITALSRKDDICTMLRNQYQSVEHVFVPAIEITENGILPVLKQLNQCLEAN